MFELIHEIKKFISSTSEGGCYNKLIKKFLTEEEINILPLYSWVISDIEIIHNDKKYKVGLTNTMSEYVSLGIVDICGDDIDKDEKCKFVIDHIDEVERSIKDISDLLKDKIERNKKKKECRNKCLEYLEDLIKTRT